VNPTIDHLQVPLNGSDILLWQTSPLASHTSAEFNQSQTSSLLKSPPVRVDLTSHPRREEVDDEERDDEEKNDVAHDLTIRDPSLAHHVVDPLHAA